MEKPTKCPEIGICPECRKAASETEGAFGTPQEGKPPTRNEPYFKAVLALCAACPLNRGKQ